MSCVLRERAPNKAVRSARTRTVTSEDGRALRAGSDNNNNNNTDNEAAACVQAKK